jgi:hypothetical protein
MVQQIVTALQMWFTIHSPALMPDASVNRVMLH